MTYLQVIGLGTVIGACVLVAALIGTGIDEPGIDE